MNFFLNNYFCTTLTLSCFLLLSSFGNLSNAQAVPIVQDKTLELASSITPINFIEDIGDVPLADGLTLMADTGFVFEQETGRIVEKMAIGSVPAKTVHFFYDQTLPQLGWAGKQGNFQRDNENLVISIQSEGELSIVTFRLTPAS